MAFVSNRTLRTCLRRLCKLSLYLLTFSVVWVQPSVRAQRVNTTIRVCVTDENEKVTDKLFLTLFNTSARIDITKPDNGNCFLSTSAQFDLAKSYFVAAVKDDKSAFSDFKLKKEDDRQSHTINLVLTRPIKNTEVGPIIRICAEDKNKNVVALEGISLSGNDNLRPDFEKNTGCVRAQLTTANEYQLQLVASGEPRTANFFDEVLGAPVPLVLVIISLFLSLGIFLSLQRVKKQQKGLAEPRSIKDISANVDSILSDIIYIRKKIDKFKKVDSPSTDAAKPPSINEPESSVQTNLPPVTTPDQIVQRPPIQIETPRSALERDVAEAKQKYQDFNGGLEIEHLSLMPIGASHASEMVAESRAKLREQDGGSYIAFCSGDGGAEAWIFPLPGLAFSPDAFSAVFPNLTEQDYQSANIEPKKAINQGPKLWKVE